MNACSILCCNKMTVYSTYYIIQQPMKWICECPVNVSIQYTIYKLHWHTGSPLYFYISSSIITSYRVESSYSIFGLFIGITTKMIIEENTAAKRNSQKRKRSMIKATNLHSFTISWCLSSRSCFSTRSFREFVILSCVSAISVSDNVPLKWLSYGCCTCDVLFEFKACVWFVVLWIITPLQLFESNESTYGLKLILFICVFTAWYWKGCTLGRKHRTLARISYENICSHLGTPLWCGPTWCSCRTNTVRIIDNDVIPIVTVRYTPVKRITHTLADPHKAW